MKQIFFLVMMLPGRESRGQQIFFPAGHFPGKAYSGRHADVFSFQQNPAALASLKTPSAGMYTERKFSLKELQFLNACFALPAQGGGFGLALSYEGSPLFHQMKTSLAYGRTVGKINAGLAFNYNTITIAGYGNTGAINADAGIAWHLSDGLYTGIAVQSISSQRFGKERQEKFPGVYSFGLGYDVSDDLFICLSVQKPAMRPVNISAGFHYNIVPAVAVDFGIMNATSAVYGIVSLKRKPGSLGIYTSYQPQLGITPGLMLTADLRKEKLK
jgi:hypothetical protein